MNKIIERILRNLNDLELIHKLSELPKSDLNSLLLELYKTQTDKLSPTEVLKSYETNRFVAPSELNPVQYHKLEADLLAVAERFGIKGLLLSPNAPLGSCSVFGCVDQNKVISATRGVETLSDPTNQLAVHIAAQLKNKEIDHKLPIHLCTTARVTRAQSFSGSGFFAHFGIFCIVSSGKASGTYLCEKELLVTQLAYYKKLLMEKYQAKLSVVLRKRSGYTDNDGFFAKMTELMKEELPDVPLSFDLEHEDNHYYKGINFKIYMHIGDEKVEIGDGGYVDWIQRMTGNKRERCLISGIGLDRLLMFDSQKV